MDDIYLTGLLGSIVTYVVMQYFKKNASIDDVHKISHKVASEKYANEFKDYIELKIIKGLTPLTKTIALLNTNVELMKKDLENINEHMEIKINVE